MSQSRLSSFIEAWINVIIGYTINFLANMILIPVFLNVPPLDWKANLIMGIPYTLISVARSYIIRRWFQGRLHAAALKLAGEKA